MAIIYCKRKGRQKKGNGAGEQRVKKIAARKAARAQSASGGSWAGACDGNRAGGS